MLGTLFLRNFVIRNFVIRNFVIRNFCTCTRITVHVVFNYLFNSILQKWVGAVRVTAPLLTTTLQRRYDMNGRFQMQGSKNRILPKEMNANRFFWDSHWLEIWSNHLCPSLGPNGGIVAMDSGKDSAQKLEYKRKELFLSYLYVLFNQIIVSIQHTIYELYCMLC